METMNCPQGNFVLHRFPLRQKETMRAWDAADEYVLEDILEKEISAEGALIINDGFGALNVALDTHRPIHIGDSEMARLAHAHNADQNGQVYDMSRHRGGLESWPQAADLVIVKIPKSLALLQHQLYQLRDVLQPETTVIGAGMTRDVHTSTIAAFEKFVGPTRTSLARKKARLILSTPELGHGTQAPKLVTTYSDAALKFEVQAYPGVFSRDKLDTGTRLLLAHLPKIEPEQTVIDLGCGSGVLGLTIARAQPHSRVEFVDESYFAVASSELNWMANELDPARARFTVGHGLTLGKRGVIDAVVCNPPFHQGRAMGDHIAWAMFTQAHRTLKPGGELRIVGNRHLGYHTKLKRLFGNCTVIASNGKFVVLSAQRNQQDN